MAIEHKSPPLGPGTAMPAPGLFCSKLADYAGISDLAGVTFAEKMMCDDYDFLTEQVFEFIISITTKLRVS